MKYLYLFGTILIMVAKAYPNEQPSVFDYNVTMNVQDPFTNLSRYFLLNVPKASQEKTSVLIVIHGYMDNAVTQAVSDNFTPKAIPMGMAVARGQSLDISGETGWNGGSCCGMVSQNNTSVDDVAYMKDMMDILVSKYNVDESRIFMTGWSNGAIMTMRTVCALGDKIKAAAPYAGALLQKKFTLAQTKGAPYEWISNETYNFADDFTEFTWKSQPDYYSCKKGHDVPMLFINGQDDILMPYKGEISRNSWGLQGFPPATFTYWYFINRNLENQTNAWKYDLNAFVPKVTQTYANQVGNSSINCFQLHSFDNHTLRANLTYCTGTGGHAWWTARPQPMDSMTAFLMGPNNIAFDLTTNILKFVCANGADCKTGEKDGSSNKLIYFIVVALVVLLILGFLQHCHDKRKSESEQRLSQDEREKRIDMA